jgi:hypothetical protein
MGKGLAAAEIIFGIILMILAISLFVGMIATNMPIILAGIVGIIALIFFILSIVLFAKAGKNLKKRKFELTK